MEEIHIIIKGARATLFAFLFFRFFAKRRHTYLFVAKYNKFYIAFDFSFQKLKI